MGNKPRIANQTSPTAFQFVYMTLAIDTINSSKVRCELLVKKQGNAAYFSIPPAVYKLCTLLTIQSI